MRLCRKPSGVEEVERTVVAESAEGIEPYACPAALDVLVLVDTSAAMRAPRRDLDVFVRVVAEAVVGIEAWSRGGGVRVGVATYGGRPRLLMPFSDDLALLEATLDRVAAVGNETLQAGLEALRVFAPGPAGTAAAGPAQAACEAAGRACVLDWRSGAQRSILMVAGGDSDLPFDAAMRMAGQAPGFPREPAAAGDLASVPAEMRTEPAFDPAVWWRGPDGFQMFRASAEPVRLREAWQAEVDATAAALVDGQVQLVLVLDDLPAGGAPVSTWDYRNPYRSWVLATGSDAPCASATAGAPSEAAPAQASGTMSAPAAASTSCPPPAASYDRTAAVHHQLGDALSTVFYAPSELEPLLLNRTATVAGLARAGLGGSLQAQMLARGASAHVVQMQALEALAGDKRNSKGVLSLVVRSRECVVGPVRLDGCLECFAVWWWVRALG
ncbi:hypothetical protein HK105_206392 [Polyrhizophydium stewartii]|uniref:VWFA domain-containing protein n=1 Tax=Polyrhizophydium stewartii TaxID=2732419 RepID=A0ABR4N3R2_9FUNG